MKELRKIQLVMAKANQQLKAFKTLLDQKSSVGEQELLDFFKTHEQLIPAMALDGPQLVHYDYIASEYDLFGDFACDFVVGSYSRKPIYYLIEFEDAQPDSVFRKKRGKHTSEWSPRFTQGFFQLIDWLYQLEDLKHTGNFRKRFGDHPEFYGLLVIGRDQFLSPADKQRFDWFSGNVLIHANNIYCKTFDDLYEDMKYKWLAVSSALK